MKKWALLVLLGLSVSSSVWADTITIRNKTYKGRLEKFENGKFTFQVRYGETLHASPSSVKMLELDKPREVSLLLSGMKKAEKAVFHGFQGSKFTYEQGGKKLTAYTMKVKKMEVKAPKPAAGGGSSEIPGPHKIIDVSHLEHLTDLPPKQSTALKAYVAARDSYQAFLVENTRMMAAADAVTGERRIAMLQDLNARKINEQPILRALEGAEAELLAAFPAE